MVKYDRLLEISRALYPYKTHDLHFHVSFAIVKNRIISIGMNSNKTTPYNLRYPKFNKFGENISQHKGTCSEVTCLRKINNKYRNINLVNIRLNKLKESCYSEPCESCKKYLTEFDIKNIIYTNKYGNVVTI